MLLEAQYVTVWSKQECQGRSGDESIPGMEGVAAESPGPCPSTRIPNVLTTPPQENPILGHYSSLQAKWEGGGQSWDWNHLSAAMALIFVCG